MHQFLQRNIFRLSLLFGLHLLRPDVREDLKGLKERSSLQVLSVALLLLQKNLLADDVDHSIQGARKVDLRLRATWLILYQQFGILL